MQCINQYDFWMEDIKRTSYLGLKYATETWTIFSIAIAKDSEVLYLVFFQLLKGLVTLLWKGFYFYCVLTPNGFIYSNHFG